MNSFKVQLTKPLLIFLILIDVLLIGFAIFLTTANISINGFYLNELNKQIILIVYFLFILIFTAYIFVCMRFRVIVSADKIVVRKVFSEKEFSISEIGFVDVTRYSKHRIKNTYFNVYFKNPKFKFSFGANYKNADKLLEILSSKGFVSKSINKQHGRRL